MAKQFTQKSIIHILPRLTKGGAETLVVSLLNDAVIQFDEVFLILIAPSFHSNILYKINKKVKILYISSSYKSLWLIYIYLFYWVIRERKLIYTADIIHGHLTFGSVLTTIISFFAPLLSEKNSKPKFIETYHAVGMPISIIKRWFHSILLKKRNAIIFVGEDSFWRVFKCRNPKVLCKHIKNGIKLPVLFSAITPKEKVKFRKNLEIPETCNVIVGTVSRMSPDRQPERFLKVFRHIHKLLGPNVHFIFSGDGPLDLKLKALAEDFGLTKYLHFTGLAKDPYYPMQCMDIYLTLAAGETIGLSGLEACAISKPVIAIQLLNIHYKTNNSNWIWSSRDEYEVAIKIIELIQSKKLSRYTAQAQFKRLRNEHSFSVLVKKYYLVYRSLIRM